MSRPAQQLQADACTRSQDANTAARQAWLARLHGRFCIVIHTRHLVGALKLAGLLLILGLIGRIDYEDAMTIQAERDAYTRALSRCTSDQSMVTAQSTTPGEGR